MDAGISLKLGTFSTIPDDFGVHHIVLTDPDRTPYALTGGRAPGLLIELSPHQQYQATFLTTDSQTRRSHTHILATSKPVKEREREETACPRISVQTRSTRA